VKLTKQQIKTLNVKGYQQDLFSLSLWKDDFKRKGDWEQICYIADVPEDTKKIRLAVVGKNFGKNGALSSETSF